MKYIIHQFRLLIAEQLIAAAIYIIPVSPEGMYLLQAMQGYYEKISALREGNGE